jgi:DNA-binding MarR family transcriptional regulator
MSSYSSAMADAPDEVDRILQQWARERPDLDASPMGIIGRMARLTRAHGRAIQATLAGHDLRADEFDVLATLRRSGKPYRLTPTQIGETSMVTSGTMTHRLDKLEGRGLITREPDPSDRRGVIIALTQKGRELVDRAVVDHLETEHGLLAPLSARDRQQLMNLLRRLSANAQE